MRRHRLALACSLGAVTLAARAAPVHAQDVAAAEALFHRGLAAMQAGRYETGCPALNESYRLDPRPGTLFTVAECEARSGKIATAATRYGDYLALFARLSPDAQAKQQGREKVATRRRAALLPDIPELTLSLPADAPEGTIVRRGEVTLGAPMLGVPLPIDPGEHVVTTQAPGAPPLEQRISIAKGEKKQITLQVNAAPAASAGAAPRGPETGRPAASRPAPPAPAPGPAPQPGAPARHGSWHRTGAIVTGSVGAAGLIVGGVTGALAFVEKATVDDNCVGTRCNPEGMRAVESSRTFALASTIGLGAGAVGLGAAVALLLTAPPEGGAARAGVPRAAPAPRVSAGAWPAGDGEGGAMVGVRGTW
ncbi:tetratricopeptide repeat protein [Sorangium sp. So ce1097]|uniref:tetratricopeptide repeat protein n=1 Tax=Sorangium sp. So ce1097 TaxID=3133330 RepID=UPI003F604E95